jgi:hypothetical protein
MEKLHRREMKYKTKLNEELKYTNKVNDIAKKIFTEISHTRKRKFGKNTEKVQNSIRLIIANLLYYNDYSISVSMQRKKDFKSNGIIRSKAYEIIILNHLQKTGFIDLVKGESWQSAKNSNRIANKTTIKIKNNVFESLVKEFDSERETKEKKTIFSDINQDAYKDDFICIRDSYKINENKFYDYLHPDDFDSFLSVRGKAVLQQTKETLIKYNKLAENNQISLFGKQIPFEKIKLKAMFGITKNLNTKGRACSGIANTNHLDRPFFMINSEKITELDYSCMHIGMLHNLNGEELSKDFYNINGYSPECRTAIKFIVNTTLNSRSRYGLHSMLKEKLEKGISKKRKIKLPAEVNKKYLIRDTISMMESYPKIFKFLYPKDRKNINQHFVSNTCGLYLRRYEARIAEAIINYFTDKNIMILPIYDSFLIAESYKEELKSVMLESYTKVVGVPPFGIKIC